MQSQHGTRAQRLQRRRARPAVASHSPGDRTSMTPLLGQVMLTATSTNRPEHAADPHDYWGSRGRGFESRRPDAGQRPSPPVGGGLFDLVQQRKYTSPPAQTLAKPQAASAVTGSDRASFQE